MEPSQRVPELSWLPRRWHSAAQRGAAWKFPVPGVAPKSCRAPSGHGSKPAFSRGYCWTENFLYLLQVIFHPTTIERCPKWFYPVWKQFPTFTSNHPSQLSPLRKQLEMPLISHTTISPLNSILNVFPNQAVATQIIRKCVLSHWQQYHHVWWLLSTYIATTPQVFHFGVVLLPSSNN